MRESGTARLEEAVAAYRAALEEWTRDRVPLDWASGALAASGETVVPLSIRRPKKRGPFQAVPVIARAMAGVSRLAPDIALCNDGNGVPLALVFAQEHGAGFEVPRAIGL